jgi:hypothetical protein
MTNAEVAVIALLAILAAVVWRKDVKAAFNFFGLGSFSLEATDTKRKHTARRKPHNRRVPER